MKNIKKLTEELNKARIAAGTRRFTYDELKIYLRGFNLLKDTNFITRVFRLLDENRRFPETPIHISVVERIYNEVREVRKKYLTNYKENMTIEKAINLLKINGYKVYKPITKFEEI